MTPGACASRAPAWSSWPSVRLAVATRLGPVWGHSPVSATSMATAATAISDCIPVQDRAPASRCGSHPINGRFRGTINPTIRNGGGAMSWTIATRIPSAARLCNRCWFRSGLCARAREAYSKGAAPDPGTGARAIQRSHRQGPGFLFSRHGPVPARRHSTGGEKPSLIALVELDRLPGSSTF